MFYVMKVNTNMKVLLGPNKKSWVKFTAVNGETAKFINVRFDWKRRKEKSNLRGNWIPQGNIKVRSCSLNIYIFNILQDKLMNQLNWK